MTSSPLAPMPILPRISDYADLYATHTPDAEALINGDQRITYSSLAAEVDKLARAFVRAGVKKGDRVATLAAPEASYFICFLATVSIGAIWVGLNPKCQTDELGYVISDAEPAVLLTRTLLEGRSYEAEISAMRQACPSLRVLVFASDPLCVGTEAYSAFLSCGVEVSDDLMAERRQNCGGRDACMIVYTSGSTGKPKGAVLHHQGVVEFSTRQNRLWPVSSVRALNYFPINHVGCVVDVSCPALVAGGCVVMMSKFAPDEALLLIGQEKITLWGSVPSVFQMQLKLPNFHEYDLSSVELIVWEGAPMPLEMIRRLRGICPRLATNYGMTESTSAITALPPTGDLDVLANTVGMPFEGVKIRLVNADRRSVGPDETGEIQAQSDQNMLGYWRRPEATAEALSGDGWLATGDLGMIRADGALTIVGRLKEMFKSGGYNVFPREIEAVLEEHEGVAAAAVVAVPDPLWQEIGIAFVVAADPTASEADLQRHCRARLANYKIPKHFEIVSDLPLLPVGKVDKMELKRRAEQLAVFDAGSETSEIAAGAKSDLLDSRRGK